jgi:hypothetical protein
METISKHIVETWPELKGKKWPNEKLGPQPSTEAVKIARMYNRPNTAVCMSMAMFARTQGASASMAAAAAALATASTSSAHIGKRNQLVRDGKLLMTTIGHKEKHQIVRITLPAQGKAPKKKAKSKKAKKQETVEAEAA